MIIGFRRFIHGKSAKVFLALITFSMIGFSLPFLVKRMGKEHRIAFDVNGYEVSITEFNKRVADEQQRFSELKREEREYFKFLLEAMGQSSNPRVRAYVNLVEESLLNDVAKNLHINPPSDFVSKLIITAYPQYFMNQQGLETLKMSLHRQGKTLEAFEEAFKEQVRRNIVLMMINSMAYVPEFQIQEEIIKRFVPRAYSVLIFPFSDYEKKAQKELVDEKVLKQFFIDENKINKRYWKPEKRSGTVWEFDWETYQVPVSERGIKDYYQRNKYTEFLAKPVQVEIRMILCKDEEKAKRLHGVLSNDSKEFASVAKKESEDSATAKKGGYVGFIKKGEADLAIEKAAFALKKDGDISAVVKTKDNDFVILQRVKKQDAEYTPLEKASADIAKKQKQEKFKGSFSSQMSSLVSNYKFNPALLETILQKHPGKRGEIKGVEQDNSPLSKQIFKAQEHVPSYVIDQNKGYLVLLDSIEKSIVSSFDEVKTTVEHDYYQKKATKLLKEAMAQARTSGKSFDELSQELHVKIKHTGLIDPQDHDQQKELVKEGLPISHMFDLEQVGAVIEFHGLKGSHDGYLIRLDDLKVLDKKELEAKRNDVFLDLYQEDQTLLSESFIASLFRNAKIELNRTFMTQREEFPV